MSGISPQSHMDTKHSGNPRALTAASYRSCFYTGLDCDGGLTIPLPKLDELPPLWATYEVYRPVDTGADCCVAVFVHNTGSLPVNMSARHLLIRLKCVQFVLGFLTLSPLCLYWRIITEPTRPLFVHFPFSHSHLGVQRKGREAEGCPEWLSGDPTHAHTLIRTQTHRLD